MGLMMRIKADNEIEFVRKIVADAVWSILYHEAELPKAHRTVAVVRALIEHGFGDIDISMIEPDDEHGAEDTDNPIDYVKACLASALAGVCFHENGLREGHEALGCVKALLARGDYTEIDIKEITTEQLKRMTG